MQVLTLIIIILTPEFLEKLMTERGLRVVENDYVKRQIENRKLNLLMDRVWIQGRYVKPGDSQ